MFAGLISHVLLFLIVNRLAVMTLIKLRPLSFTSGAKLY